ncbi:MAG: hypothetical protein RIB60_04710 [Phycisphaerales bacterium]
MAAPLTEWADRIERVIAETPDCCVDRVVVIAETASTQDAAAAHAGGRPGLLVLTGRQTAGRGRMGRTWADTADAGLAVTFALPDDPRDPGELAAVGGIAARDALAAVAPGMTFRLKRPNDVLAIDDVGNARKIAGVLIERRDGLTLIGIGTNVAQDRWPDELAESAVSLVQLGVGVDRIELAAWLVRSMSAAVRLSPREIASRWSASG